MNNANPKDLAELALNAACLAIQDALGVDSGDVAAMFFSGAEESAVLEIFTRYAQTEINFGADQHQAAKAAPQQGERAAYPMLWPHGRGGLSFIVQGEGRLHVSPLEAGEESANG